MTTSYELSLKLKELGVEQENGEYYWVRNLFNENEVMHNSVLPSAEINFVICQALTLGELVRELASKGILETYSYTGKNGLVTYVKMSSGLFAAKESTISPEEAAGELLAEIKSQEKEKEG